MGRSEAPFIMPEDTELGFTRATHGTPASPVTEPPSILSQIRKRSVPLFMATGLLFGGLVDQQRPVSAQEPQPPAGGSIYLPALQGGGVEPGATPTYPSDHPTRTPRATATRTPTSSPTAPERTPTAPATSTPTETTTPTPTPTETPTSTEAGPLKELAINKGDTLVLPDTASFAYAMSGKNGDPSSGALHVGYNFESLADPVIHEGYVVGTAKGANGPLTVRVPIAEIDQRLLDRLTHGDPQNDERLNTVVHIWNGENEGPLLVTVNSNGSTGVYGRPFFGNLANGAQIEFTGRAAGTSKSAGMSIMSWDENNRRAEKLIFLTSTQKNEWRILASTQTGMSLEQALATRSISNELNDESQEEKELYRYPIGQGNVKVQIKDGSLLILDEDGKITSSVPLPIAMSDGQNYIDFIHDGLPRSQATVTLEQGSITIPNHIEGEPLKKPENLLPTFVDVANANDLRIMAQASSTTITSQPGFLQLLDRTAHIIDTNTAYKDGADLQRFLLDQNRKPAIVLGAGLSKQELLDVVNSHPNSIFQFVARGTNNGPDGVVVKPDGALMDKGKLQAILDLAAAKGSEVILNTTTPLDLKLFRSLTVESPARLSPQLRLMEDLKTLRNQGVMTVMFAGDSRFILDPDLSRKEVKDSVVFALKTTQDAGFNVGLTNISGGTDEDYYDLIGDIASELTGLTLGFGTNLTTKERPLGLFDFRSGFVKDNQIARYSTGQNQVYTKLVANLVK